MKPARSALRLAASRAAYRLLSWPLAALMHLRERPRRHPDAGRRARERFGFAPALAPGAVWVHAASVGETLAVAPLLRAWLERHPQRALLLTTATTTGAERARALFGERLRHAYCPHDTSGAVRRFLARTRPAMLVLVEKELWPNLLGECRRRGVPVALVNARMSARSARRYRRFGALSAEALGGMALIAAQSRADRRRFVALGAPPERCVAVGNLKYERALEPEQRARAKALRRAWGPARPVWLAASVAAAEEEAVLDARAALAARFPGLLLALAPRHPQRFDAAARACRRRGLNIARRGAGEAVDATTEVALCDTIGELPMIYGAADAAFVGGSLTPRGGHNPLEAALWGCPVAFGPHTFNFVEISRALERAGAAARVGCAVTLAARIGDWLADPAAARRAGDAARGVLAAQRGALARSLALLEPQLAAATPASGRR